MASKKFKADLENFHGKLWGHHLIVPDKVASYFLDKKIKRVRCTVNKEHQFQCAIMPKGDGRNFIMLNKEIRDKLKLKVGVKVEIELEEDKSKYGLPMPEEMQELLNQDPEGNTIFHKLTPGKQRSLLYIIGKPKSSNLRLHKALVVIEHLKYNNGHIDFKALNQEMKIKK